MVDIELNPNIPTEKWRHYVTNHPEGLIFHLPEWQEILEQTFHHKPYYFFALSENDIWGILPLFQIRSLLTGNRLISLPFTQCGPIADSEEVVKMLVGRAKELCDVLKCRYLEIRMNEPIGLGLNTSNYFSTYILELSDLQATWRKLDPKSIRWAINKARKDGVTIRPGNSTSDLGNFYRLNLDTKKRLGVPGHPLNFFENLFAKMGTATKLYLAELAGSAIAGIITIGYRDTVHYSYAASDVRYLKYHASSLLVWQSIEDSCNAGYRYFDFGRTAADDKGLIRFKKHWGAEEKKLYYYYYPESPALISANRSGIKYRLVTSMWRGLPTPLTQTLSPLAFRHLD